MWGLSFAIFCGFKWLTWRRTLAPNAPLWRHVGYLLAWPGMDAAAFLGPSRPPRPTVANWLFAVGKLALGLALLYGVAPQIPDDRPYLLGWIGMAGIAFTLHFGVFHLMANAWRAVGVDAKPLMNWPAAAVSASEFWGKRWNLAFRDLTHRFLFKPLTVRLGPRRAVVAGFLFSGLVHDVVISGPAGGGYGGPTVFFLIQGLAIFAERSRVGKRLGLGRRWRGWLFTAAALLGPAALLFHPPFVVGVVVPFLHVIGAVK